MHAALLLWTLVVSGSAHASPGLRAEASPDGRFTLWVEADVDWSDVEVVVGDAVTTAEGLAAGTELRVDGVSEAPGAVLEVRVEAVDLEGHGLHWELWVEPAWVPSQALEPSVAAPARGFWSLLWRR